MRTIVRGDFAWAPDPSGFRTVEDGYMVVENGRIRSIEKEVPELRPEDDLLDYRGRLILPGFADMHLHAPQFPNIGLGADMELLPWLETYTFPEEARYREPDYAGRVYRALINRLWEEGTLYSALFATIHREPSTMLFDLFVRAGLHAFVGKVNMDRNSPDFYVEKTEASLSETERFITENLGKSERVHPIVTPRFVPSCTEPLMQGLGELAARYDLAVQSHLDENLGEIEWVCQLHPDANSYSQVYRRNGLFGQQPTFMGHCIYCNEEELDMMREAGVVAVHCPFSNANLISGIMPVRAFLDHSIPVMLGSDISGGHEISMPRVMVLAMQLSKMLAVANAQPESFLTAAEAFHLGTRAGARHFGDHGSFEEGFFADFLVIDDSPLLLRTRSLAERVEKFLYVGDASNIQARFLAGEKVPRPFPEA